MSMLVTNPTALSATALIAASGTAMYTTKAIPEIQKEINEMKVAISSAKQSASAAEIASTRAASSLASIVKSMPASKIVSEELKDEDREKAIAVNISKVIAPVNENISNLKKSYETFISNCDDLYSKFDSLEQTDSQIKQRIFRLESMVSALTKAVASSSSPPSSIDLSANVKEGKGTSNVTSPHQYVKSVEEKSSKK